MAQHIRAWDGVFARHSRPQAPTLPPQSPGQSRRLSVTQTPSWIPQAPGGRASNERKHKAREVVQAQWVDYIQYGTLIQGQSEFIVCASRADKASLYMFKKSKCERHQKQAALTHSNLLEVKLLISTNIGVHLGYEYIRYTLEELLNVHIPIEEAHIQTIAKSVFAAIKYLNQQGLSHGQITTDTIRISNRTGEVLLGDCDECLDSADQLVTKDLEDLALVLLRSMESPSNRTLKTAEEIRESCAANKGLGLSNAERWSGSKQLVEFIDDLLSGRRRAKAKLAQPHLYVRNGVEKPGILLPMVELASLECFALWRAVQ